MKMPNAVQNAYEIVALWEAYEAALDRIEFLQDYERKYRELLNEDVAHGQKMMVNWLDLLLSDRIKIVKEPS